MTTHTPGPWQIGKRSLNDNSVSILGTESKKVTNCSFIAYVDPRPFYNDGQEANALLIAAAPDLLEACQAVTNAWSEKEHRDAVVKCLAVIAKATIPSQEEPTP